MSGSPHFSLSSSKPKGEMTSKENDFGDEFIHETATETTLFVDEIDIKYEEMDYHLHSNSTADEHSDLTLETMSSIAHIECGDDKGDEKDKDLNNFYHDISLCERDCDTCVKMMRMLSKHVRAAHAPHQPIQEPIHMDHVPVLLADHPSSSIQIKSEVDEDIVKMDSCDSEEMPTPSSDSDPDYNVESESESDPDYAPSPSLTNNLRHEGQGLAENQTSNQSRSSKPKKESLQSREHFKCGECGKSFTQKRGLISHMSVHTGEKPFRCDLCERSFTRSDHLIQHRRIHTGERPYKCNVCQMSFTVSTSLKEHTRIHTGEKPYKCDMCEKSFSRSNTLTEHRRLHTAGDKPCKCDLCEKSFRRSNQLTIHMIRHTGDKPYKCEVCETSFTSRYFLTTHQRIHSEEEPHKCDVCDKCFTTSNVLTAHKRIHTGENPFKCDLCEKGFRTTGKLTTHKRTHTQSSVVP